MSRFLKLVPLILLCLCLLYTVLALSPRGPSSHQAEAAVARRLPGLVTKPAPDLSPAIQHKLEQQTTLATTAITAPARWSRPPQREVVEVLRRDQEGAALLALSGSSEPPEGALSGSYAVVLANQIGEASGEERLSADYLHVHLRRDFSLGRQSSENIALVLAPTRDLETVGSFLLRRESSTEDAGWYLIALHLANPTDSSYRIRNGIFCMTGIMAGGTILDRTETIPAHSTLMVPVLYQWRASGSDARRLLWSAQIWSEGSGLPLLVFQGLTVDRL